MGGRMLDRFHLRGLLARETRTETPPSPDRYPHIGKENIKGADLHMVTYVADPLFSCGFSGLRLAIIVTPPIIASLY